MWNKPVSLHFVPLANLPMNGTVNLSRQIYPSSRKGKIQEEKEIDMYST